MTQPHDPLIDAAFAMFSRDGLRKATMGDIAAAAGVSRQTLYNRFENKDQVFRAAVLQLGQQQLALMQTQWTHARSLTDKIEAFFQCGPVFLYDLICKSPKATDLIEGIHAIDSADMAKAHAQWHVALAEMLRPYDNQIGNAGTNPTDLADFLYSSAYSAKGDATDRAHLLRRLGVLKTAVLAITNETSPPK